MSGVDAMKLVDRSIERMGFGYHPDTRGEDYVDPFGSRVLTDAEAEEWNRLHDAAFESGYGEFMYQRGMDVFARMVKRERLAEFAGEVKR